MCLIQERATLAPPRRPLNALCIRATIEALERRLCLSAISLLPAVHYDAGTVTTKMLAVGDFNNNGKPDLVVVDGQIVNVLLNKGDGTFSAPISSNINADITAIAVGDFNHDGAMDLALGVTLSGNARVDIFLGLGDGTFITASPEQYFRPEPAVSIAAADFNGDGVADLAITNYKAASVTILLNNGDGTFTDSNTYPAGSEYTGAVTVGDFNGDHANDLAVASINPVSSDLVSVLLGNSSPDPADPRNLIPDGTFGAATDYNVGSNPVLAPGFYDFNGDGNEDLATVNSGDGTVSVLLGDGNGGFGAATSNAMGGNLSRGGVGDFNGDGHADLAAANGSDIKIRLGNGDGTFQLPVTLPIGEANAGSLAVWDLNGDGKPDIAVADISGVSVLLSSAPDSTPPTAKLGVPLSPVTMAGGTYYPFAVTYSDNVAVKASTLATGAVRVTGPGGFSQLAALGAVDVPGDGTPRSATYRITPPGGTWDAADNGTYTVSLLGSKVSDTSGNFAVGRTLGTFAVNIAAPATASIAGTVFNDANSNGLRGTTEKGLAGVKLFLDTNKNGKPDAGEKFVLSDAAGAFHFNFLSAGTYRVRQVVPMGFRATTPSAGFYDIVLTNGQAVSGKAFGDTQRVLIAGTVFNDVNGDGKRAASDIGLSGWTLNLFLNGVGKATVVTTDKSGNWSISSLAAGKYVVRVVQKTGYKLTNPLVGSFNLTLAAGRSAIGLLFGEHKI